MHHTEVPLGRPRAATRSAIRICGLAASALGLLAVFAACSDESPTRALPTASRLQAVVTGAAATALDQDGRIHLPAPARGAERELTAVEAVTFASAWTRDYAPMTRSWLEDTHGAAIDFKTLTSCGRPLYARSAFNAPPQGIPGPYRRIHGPWWLVTFCDAARAPSVSIAVSAWATELTMESGKLRFPRVGGTELVAVGIPVGHVGEYPSAPEVAMEFAARQTGRRVSEVPELVTPLQTDGPPQLARWRVTLDGLARVRTGLGERAITEVFVGPRQVGGKEIVASVAAQVQSAAIDLDWAPLPVIGEQGAAYRARATRKIAKITRRRDTPAEVEPISAPENP